MLSDKFLSDKVWRNGTISKIILFIPLFISLSADKELRASYKLKQRWSEFLNDDRSAEYAVLSGNFEQAVRG